MAVFIFAQIMMAIMGMIFPMPPIKGNMMLMMLGSIMGHIIFGITVALLVKKQALRQSTNTFMGFRLKKLETFLLTYSSCLDRIEALSVTAVTKTKQNNMNLNKNQLYIKEFADKVQINKCKETLLVNENAFKALLSELLLTVSKLKTIK